MTVITLLGIRLRHGNCMSMLHLLLLLLLLVVLRCLRMHHCSRGMLLLVTWLLVLHLLLLLLQLEVWRKVDEALAHLTCAHGSQLLWVHVWYAVWESHTHAALGLSQHCLLLLLAHESMLLGVPLLLL